MLDKSMQKFGLSMLLLLYAAHVSIFRNYLCDDAFISFRYAANLARGNGLAFNPGAMVEGFSSPLFTWLAAAFVYFGEASSLPQLMRGLGVGAGAATVIGTYLLAKRHTESSLAGLVSAGLLVASPALALNAWSGLETTTYTACLVLGSLWTSTGAGLLGGTAFGAAVLLRPEGIAVVAAHELLRWCVSDRPRSLRKNAPTWMIPVVAGLALLGWRLVVFDGAWLPNTFFAKSGGFWGIPRGEYVLDGILPPFLGAVGLAVGVTGFFLDWKRWKALVPLGVVGILGALLPLWLGSDWMPGHRLIVPYVPWVSVLVGAGWWRILHGVRPLRGSIAWVLGCAVIGLAWMTQSPQRDRWHNEVEIRARGYSSGHVALGQWLENQGPGSLVALMDLGLIGFHFPDLRLLDLSGLTDPVIARSPGVFLDKHYPPAYVLEQAPDFIVLVATGTEDRRSLRPSPDAMRMLIPHEQRLYDDPEFQRLYVRSPNPAGADDDPWLHSVADGLGAERIFQHDHPDRAYLLATFRRLDPAETM